MRVNRTFPKQMGHSIIRKDGSVVLPVEIQDFAVGQRVYFHVRGDGVAISAQPQLAACGRFFSSRVRKAVRSLATYGPRAAHPLNAKKVERQLCASR